jgi:CRISPR-associated protein Cse1 (CRISPR_cse1)
MFGEALQPVRLAKPFRLGIVRRRGFHSNNGRHSGIACGLTSAAASSHHRRGQLPRIFPWLAPTRLSNKGGRNTTPEDVDWRQVFFGMPRRIRLNLEQNVDRTPCDLTGAIEDVIVRTYRTLPHGANYEA